MLECRNSCFCTELVVGLYFNKYFTSHYGHRFEARACADVLLICLHMYIHGHIQKYTCTYENINNFKLSAFLLQIVYIHCMWGEIVCALPVIGLNPLCCRGSV